MNNQNYRQKQCPECKLVVMLDAPACPSCGHKFRTQFAGGPSSPPPSDPQTQQTQAFGAQGDQTQAFMGSDPQTQAFYPPQSGDGLAFLHNFPPFVCFILGFFVHIVGILLLIAYFGYRPTYNPRLGYATMWGLITSVVIGILLFVVPFLLMAFGIGMTHRLGHP